MENYLCQIHNEHVLYYEQDANQNQIFLCRFCAQKRLNIKNIEDAIKEEKQALKELEMEFDKSINLLKGFAEVLDNFTQSIYQKLKKFKLQVEQSILHMIEKKNQAKDVSNDFTKLQLNKINEQKTMINDSLIQIIKQLNTQIKQLEISTRLTQLSQSIDQQLSPKQESDIIQISVIEQILQKQYDFDKKIEYKLMHKSNYYQGENCYAIAFNKDATIMIAGCDKSIKIFQFKDDKLNELQQLSRHSQDVNCLHFMKKSNKFVSGSLDSTVIIWECKNYNLWICKQILQSHTGSIKCILMDQNEDLLISGSYDKTIKFWKKQNDTWSCNQSIDCKNRVYSISQNDQEDELIASVENKQILVLQLQGKEWKIKQSISVEQDGYRLCFINQNQFLFQPYKSKNLQIFHKIIKEKTYLKVQILKYENQEQMDYSLFPIQYLSQIGLIIVKNGNYVHLIKRDQDGNFIVEQSISFDTNVLYGCITDDGKYICTWDNRTFAIQIRKFEF